MPNEIYHRSEWGNPKAEGFGDVYFDAAATNKLYNHSDYYENSDGTDKILRDIPNKASIVLTPTAYSDGSLNTVIPPYQVLPTELVTNGTFDTDSDWIKDTGWSISGGFATRTNTGSFGALYQNCLTSGKKYEVTITISSITSQGFFGVRLGTNYILQGITEAGTYTETGTSTSATLSVMGNPTFAGSIDNISIKEIQEADFDFSRGSSATRVNEKGLIEDVASGIPRIDYTSGFGSLLLEPQRTNLITYSEDFSGYTFTNIDYTANNSISPDGFVNATKITPNTLNTFHDLRTSANISLSSGNNTLSFFIKSNGYNFFELGIASNLGFSKYATAVINLTDGTNANTGVNQTWTIINVNISEFNNDWYRLELTFNADTSTSTAMVFASSLPTSTRGVSFQGDGTSGAYIWGAQLEAGSYPTSYIPTSGSTVTRSADVANNSGNADLINSTEGTLYTEIEGFISTDTVDQNRYITLTNGTSNERVALLLGANPNQLRAIVYSNTQSINLSFTTSLTDVKQFNKLAVKYKSGDYAFFLNGTKIDSSSETSIFSENTLNDLSFDVGGGTQQFRGKTKELAVFKEALTDAELESLTSWISFTEMATDLEYTLE